MEFLHIQFFYLYIIRIYKLFSEQVNFEHDINVKITIRCFFDTNIPSLKIYNIVQFWILSTLIYYKFYSVSNMLLPQMYNLNWNIIVNLNIFVLCEKILALRQTKTKFYAFYFCFPFSLDISAINNIVIKVSLLLHVIIE